jgi:hypothetical protein
MRSYLREMNVDIRLADEMLRIDPDQVRYLSRAELNDYRVGEGPPAATNMSCCMAIRSKVGERLLLPIPPIDRGEGSSCRYRRRSIVVLLRTVRSVMQEGAPSVRFVARAGRQGRHSGGPEEMRTDGDADRHPCGFGNELAH